MQAIRSKDKLSPTGGCSLAYCPCVSIDACVVISALNQRAPDSICCTGNGGYSLDRAVVRRLICSLKRPSAPFRARQASNPEPEAALSDTIQHLAKMNNHDVRAPIFGVGREVAINRGILILTSITTNHHDLPRTVLLAPLLDQINCVRKPADEGCVDHCGCPCLATARPIAAVRSSASPPQGTPVFLSARR